MTTQDDKARFRQTYEAWIQDEGAELRVNQTPNVFSDSVYTHGNGMTVRIIQFNDKSDKILITARLAVPGDAQQQLGELSETERRDISNDIALALTQIGVQYNIQIVNTILQGVILERVVFGVGLNKQIFFDNLYRIIDAIVMTSTLISKKLGGNITSSGGNPSFYG
jgi:hypothetical protein